MPLIKCYFEKRSIFSCILNCTCNYIVYIAMKKENNSKNIFNKILLTKTDLMVTTICHMVSDCHGNDTDPAHT